LSLNEDFDEFGRLIQTMGTFTQNGFNNQGLPTWGLPYLAATTENPTAGSTEVWQIMNLTGDTHPIHFHLVNVQLIQRRPFTGVPGRQGVDWHYSGPPTPPDPNEIGWKETIRMNPGEVTTVIMKFDLPNLPTAAMRNAVSPRTGGKEYVWHCHILEHEEHDMMRPLIVT
jgi:spore coat protein A